LCTPKNSICVALSTVLGPQLFGDLFAHVGYLDDALFDASAVDAVFGIGDGVGVMESVRDEVLVFDLVNDEDVVSVIWENLDVAISKHGNNVARRDFLY